MPIIYVLLLVIVSTALPARAVDDTPDDSGAVMMRLEEKLRQHPEIAAYVSRAEASSHYAKGELGLPDPMLFIQEQDYPIGGSQSRGEEQKMIGFKQTIPAFGTRGAKSERMGIESHKNKLLGDYAFAAMKAKMITALANLERIKKQEKLLSQQAALFGSERSSIKGRIAANQAGVSQLSMSEADSTDIELMRAELDEEKHEMMAMLENMLGEAPDIATPTIEKVVWNNEAEKSYPVAIARADIDMAHKDVNLRKSEFNPNFEVQANYGRMNGGDNSGTIMLGLSIPLWASESQRPRLEGAKATVRATEFDQEMVRRQTVEKLTHLEAQIATSERKLELLKRKESLLQASSGAQVREYEAGKADFAMPLKTRREALSVRYQLAEEEAKHTSLIADFNRYLLPENSHE